MWKKPERNSAGELGPQDRNSVFDIFYHDPRRIGSFLSQFDPNGHLQGITATVATQEAENSSGGTEISIGIPTIVEAKTPVGWGATSGVSDSASKTYDPIWANALAFLDYLHQHNLIHKDVDGAGIGQFIQASGELALIDLQFMQRLYQLEPFKEAARNWIDPVTQSTRNPVDVELDIEVMQIVPPQLQAYLTGENDIPLFGGLKEDGLASSRSEIFMKYGIHVDGEWTVVGIKDANPLASAQEVIAARPQLLDALPESSLLREYAFVAARTRGWLGRQPQCYGITPLVIFRQIGA